MGVTIGISCLGKNGLNAFESDAEEDQEECDRKLEKFTYRKALRFVLLAMYC
jgi:hypothetical protein